jgi:hypothetical protein
MAVLRETQDLLDVIDTGAAVLRESQALLDVVESLRTSPTGGGGGGTGTDPAAASLGTGVKRVFMRLTIVSAGSPYSTSLAIAESRLSDGNWFGGPKAGTLISISSFTRELSDSVRGVQTTVGISDVDVRFRTLADADALAGSIAELFVVEDDVRYLENEPYRIFTGRVYSHKAAAGFRYELTLRDALSEELAVLDDAPRIPPGILALTDFPGMIEAYEGKSIPLVLGQCDDSVEPGNNGAPPQGVIPPMILGVINFQDFGGANQEVIACIWSQCALASNGIWQIYVNLTQVWASGKAFELGMVVVPTPNKESGFLYVCVQAGTSASTEPTWPTGVAATVTDGSVVWQRSGVDTDRDKRVQVPLSYFGVYVWTPGMPGWDLTPFGANEYVDYPTSPAADTRRYTPLYIANNTVYSKGVLDGKFVVAGNLYGVAENPDGTGNYMSDAPVLYQWLLENFLYSEYRTGAYSATPDFAGLFSIINTQSMSDTTTRLRGFGGGSYNVGFMLGRDGQQQTLRHILEELCAGVGMEQGIDRHGRLMVDAEDPSAAATVHLSDLFDIEADTFEVTIDRDAYRNRVEYVYGYRYVDRLSPTATPNAGDPLPKSTVKKYLQWTSGLQALEHTAAIATNDNRKKTIFVENYVVRAPSVAQDVAQRLLDQSVGQGPGYDGPRMFRLTTSWQGLCRNGAEVELGTVIAIDHIEGLGASGWTGQKCRVLRITVDPLNARVTLEGRVFPVPVVAP